MIDPKVIQEMGMELQKLIKRELRNPIDRMELNANPEEFEKTFRSLLSFGWMEIEPMAEGDISEVDPLLNRLFFTLGEGTLSGALGAAVIGDLLARRLFREERRPIDSSQSPTFPLFTELDFVEDTLRCEGSEGAKRISGELSLIPRAAQADTLAILLPCEKQLVSVSLKGEGISWQGPIETLGIRSCPLYDVHFHKAPLHRSVSLSTRAEIALSSARGWLLSLTAGLFSGGLQKGMDYAQERYQGGDLLSNHTGFRTILSKLQTTLWSAEALMERMPQTIQEEGKGPQAVRQSFAEAIESLATKVEDIIQVFGGYGYMEDFMVERVFRDVTHLAVAFGRRGFDRTVGPRGEK